MKKRKLSAIWKRFGTWGKRCADFCILLLYPPRCPICDGILPVNSGRRLCADCEKKLPWIVQPYCMKCGKPLEDPRLEYCEDCRLTGHAFDQGMAAFRYTGKMRDSVSRMKFGNRRDYLDFYAEAMAACGYRRLCKWQPDAIVPVPMHWKKQNRRGFNQSEQLAKRIGRLTGIPVRCDLVRKCRDTRNQKELSRAERRKNLAGAFVLKKQPEGLRTVVIVDDIYTTGSTVDALASLLRQAGVERVCFLVLCTGKV